MIGYYMQIKMTILNNFKNSLTPKWGIIVPCPTVPLFEISQNNDLEIQLKKDEHNKYFGRTLFGPKIEGIFNIN